MGLAIASSSSTIAALSTVFVRHGRLRASRIVIGRVLIGPKPL
jgi:hypothetical protein